MGFLSACCPYGFLFPLYIPVFLFPIIFQGLDLLKRASSLREEACRLKAEAQHLETKGLGKMEVVVAGLRGRRFLWASEGNNVTLLHIFHPTSPQESLPYPIHHHLPYAPSGVHRTQVSNPADQAMESASPAVLPVSEEVIPANMQPLCIQLGGVKWVYRCQVEGCKEGPSTSQATISAHVHKVHLGVGLVCPSCSKSFFNLDTFWCYRKSHINL